MLHVRNLLFFPIQLDIFRFIRVDRAAFFFHCCLSVHHVTMSKYTYPFLLRRTFAEFAGFAFGNRWLGTWLRGTPGVGVHVFLLGTHTGALAAV